MPSIRGAGTIHYGKHDTADDGTYVTTRWITFVYLPLVPAGSFRVRPTGRYYWDWPVRFREVERIERVPMTRAHVWHGYRNVLILIGIVAALVVLTQRFVH
jgi:hypothetical protein